MSMTQTVVEESSWNDFSRSGIFCQDNVIRVISLFQNKKMVVWGGGLHSTVLASQPAAQGSVLGAPNNFYLYVAEIY